MAPKQAPPPEEIVLYGVHPPKERRRRHRDLQRGRTVRAPVVPLLRLGSADVDVGVDDGAAAVPGDGVHNRVVARDYLEADVGRYALACARNRPTDSIFQQKMFFEVVKQFQGEYLGSMLSAVFESMGGTARPDGGSFMLGDAIDVGLADAVNDNDAKFPPEFRLSKSKRSQPE